jgi:hypothetical protein
MARRLPSRLEWNTRSQITWAFLTIQRYKAHVVGLPG